jgi:hypothetical protein
MSDEQSFIKDNALAGGAITISLLEMLVEKGVLTISDCRAVLDRARAALLIANANESMAAARYISQITGAKFPAGG